ncbi:hypothetical protein ACQEVF_44800 [Nonomuraea polychroma]|uniref:hypothetical protein n=1 Tax=Nonomuraea polychroma TaxID=46176 RepID=UPI003D92AD73
MVVEQARAAGDWRGVEEFTQTWWIIACVSMQDPEDRQRVWGGDCDATDQLF